MKDEKERNKLSKKFFGKKFALPELYSAVMKKGGIPEEDIGPALQLLRQVAGNQIRVFKGKPFPTVQIVDPFALGGQGSAPEDPDVDAEDALTATGSAQYPTSSIPDPGAAGDAYKGRTSRKLARTLTRDYDPESTISGGPQKLAPQEGDKWMEIEGRANQALLKYGPGRELPDPEEIESIINDIKSVASEYPEKAREIKGYLDSLGEMIPQREWFDLYESMCLNGI